MPYWRLPRGEISSGKWYGGKRSACVHCGVQLRTRDLFPIFNWLITRGRCFNCQAPVNPVYFFIELSCAVLAALVYLRFGISESAILVYGMCVCLVILAATDYSFRVFPNALMVVFVLFATNYRVLVDHHLINMLQQFVFTVLGLILFYNSYQKICGKSFPGLRYLQMLSLAALCLPLSAYAGFFLLFLALALFAHIFSRSGKSYYGTVLALSLVLHLFYPGMLWGWLK